MGKTYMLGAAAAALAGFASGGQAAAQSGIESIVVTAERREANLQTAPVAITAITADQVENLGLFSAQDIGKVVPNLQLLPVTANPSTFQVGFRGGVEQVSGLIVSEPVVGIYVDDVYRARLQGANLQLADIERIEVLRGPQGTLYGRNTFSGAIKIVTRTPSLENQWAEAAVGYGSFNEVNVRASLGGGISESVGGSLSVFYRDQEHGWIFNRAQDRDIGAEENLALRGKLVYDEGPWNATLAVSYDRDDNDGYIPVAVQTDPPGQIPFNRETRLTTNDYIPRFGDDPYVTEFPQESVGETETFAVTLDLSRDFGGVTLRSITGYVDLTDVFRWDLAAGLNPAPGVFTPAFDRRADAEASQITQELQAQGNSLDGRLDWIFGLFYFAESGDQTLVDEIPLFGLPMLDPTILDIDTDSWAVFGQATYAATDRLSFTLGGRFSQDNKKFNGSIQDFASPTLRTDVELDETFSSFTPKFGVEFDVSDDIFTYASVARGFKAGGFNGLAVLNPLVLSTAYGPQNVWTYEVGLKSEWFDNRVRANVAGFINDISDIQQTAQIGAGSFAIQNVGDATVKGIELELTAQPVDPLTLFANVGWMDGDYDRIDPASQAAQSGATDIALLTEWTGQFGAIYSQPILDKYRIDVGATANYVGEHFIEVTNVLLIESYTRYDVFASIGEIDDRVKIRGEVKNLTDEANFVSGIVNVPFPALTPLRPRTWMLTLSAAF